MSCSSTNSEMIKGTSCGCGPECKCGCQPSACAPKGDCSDKTDCAPKKCCPIKCVLTVILGGILAAMVMYLFEGFWHGTYLAPIYDQTKTLWRSLPEMQSLGGTYAMLTIGLGLVLSFIFAQNYKGKGVAEGIRYGFYIGLLLGIKMACAYTTMPIPLNLAVLWFFGWIIEGVLVGITLSLTFLAVTGGKSKGDCKPKGACGPVPASCGDKPKEKTGCC